MEFEDEYVEEFEEVEEHSQQESNVAMLFQHFDKERWEAYRKRLTEPCAPFSLPSLTKHCKGHALGTVTLLIAPSGVGKTMFTIQEMYEDIKFGYDVVYVSYENSPEMLFEAISSFVKEDEEKFMDIVKHVHYLGWEDFYNSSVSKLDFYKEHNIHSIYIDYVAGDLFCSSEAFAQQDIMKNWMRQFHKAMEACNMYGHVCAQMLPMSNSEDVYDGMPIQSCKSLHQPVDVYMALRKNGKGKRIQVVKNRRGTYASWFNLDLTTDYVEADIPTYYDGDYV